MSHNDEHDPTQHLMTLTKRRVGEAEPYEVIHVPLTQPQEEQANGN